MAWNEFISWWTKCLRHIAQKMKFSIKGFFSKCDQIRRKLRIWLHLLKKSLMENFIFCAVAAEKGDKKLQLNLQKQPLEVFCIKSCPQKFFRYTYFEEHLRTTASAIYIATKNGV